MKINETKLFYKSISEFFTLLETYPENWVFIDTETTGLGGAKVQQLTQISGIILDKDFKEISSFDKKIKLTSEIETRMEKDPEFPNGMRVDKKHIKNPWSTKKILKFNHYTSGNYEYFNEEDIINKFFNWLGEFEPYTLIAQNASFDMAMLGGRYGHKIDSPVIDTKMIIQLYYIPLLQTLAETNPKYQEIINKIGFSTRDNGLISSSMSVIGPSLGINMNNYHDALTDCIITIEMVKRIIDLLTNNQNVNISKYQIERIKSIRI